MKLILILLILWMISGLVALVMGVKALHKPENRETLQEQLDELSAEFNLKEDTCLCILYVAFVVFGFAGIVPVVTPVTCPAASTVIPVTAAPLHPIAEPAVVVLALPPDGV